jgi:hypothetical protein
MKKSNEMKSGEVIDPTEMLHLIHTLGCRVY